MKNTLVKIFGAVRTGAIAASLLVFAAAAQANDLSIQNGQIVSVGAGEATIQFDINWNNSWRDQTNYDAVWVFVKYSVDGGNTWRHATLKSSGVNPSGSSAGDFDVLELFVPLDKKGVFVQRGVNGSGAVSSKGIEIVWDHTYDNVNVADIENVGLKVFGIEMVYVPDGAFYAGDGKMSAACFVQGNAPAELDPWYVDSEKAIRAENIASNGFYYTSAGNPGEDATGSEFIVSASFPKGSEAFYCMKYEITEGQWTGFLNTLTLAQKVNRDITGASGKNSDTVVNRNTLVWDGQAEVTSLRPDRACGYLSWMDLCAYADWAALRPMTELEFEKACRGEDIMAVQGELPWGNTNVSAAISISGPENGTEGLANAESNSCYGDQEFSGGDGGRGPLRAGIFATANSSRQQSGAGYYGILEMSGNVWERCVTVGNAPGRVFLGTNGDGVLESGAGFEGNANSPDWPGYANGQGVSSASGAGFRGGSWFETTTNFLAISNRSRAAFVSSSRGKDFGGRCVRTVE